MDLGPQVYNLSLPSEGLLEPVWKKESSEDMKEAKWSSEWKGEGVALKWMRKDGAVGTKQFINSGDITLLMEARVYDMVVEMEARKAAAEKQAAEKPTADGPEVVKEVI